VDKQEKEIIYKPRLRWSPQNGGNRWRATHPLEEGRFIPLWIQFRSGTEDEVNRPIWKTFATIGGKMFTGRDASWYTRRHTDEATSEAETHLLFCAMICAEHILVVKDILPPRPNIYVGMVADGKAYGNVHCGTVNANSVPLSGCGRATTTYGYWYYLRYPMTPDVELYGGMSSVHFCAACAPYYVKLAEGSDTKLVVAEGGGCETIRERRERKAAEDAEDMILRLAEYGE
jgi:hypothetical protein